MNGLWVLILASEEQAAGGGAHEQPSLFTPDVGSVVWTLLIFALLLVVLRKFAWGPILRALQDREKFITNSLDSARREREDATKLLADYQSRIDKSREEATAIVEEGRRDAEAVRKRIHAEAKGEADAMIARARREIEIARDDAIKELYDRTIHLASGVADKIVRRQLAPADHKALLDESLEELSRVGR